MLPVPDEGAVEEFAAAAVDPAFHDRVHPWDPDAAEDDLDAGVGEDGVEQRLVRDGWGAERVVVGRW